MKVSAFIPCRAGSERVPKKNMRPFGGYEGGLLEIKLKQLGKCDFLDEIIISTNDPDVVSYAEFFSKSDRRIVIDDRPDHLGKSSTSMTEFIQYISSLRPDGAIFWTHVTTPFCNELEYIKAYNAYLKSMESGHDSFVSVTKLQKFLWNNNGPINYDNSVEKWPRSQDLQPVYEINHAIYAMKFGDMRDIGDRIGGKPFFYEMEEVSALDIDWEEQFHLLDLIAKAKPELLGGI
ncbi:acylneuraminate cytidylyltransferase family protein [Asticcacaulis machinosus]|uniref:Acylneuraminate cytidylyltransferase family protein n=1 Tax=Asticcacaulis machinosus TaxID=2984211 RepID=A0ABT5HJN6_9CAUL|nr:acylneuraminate cytidylyltransferase family protein [Asticcacaulis machinosus]MDC7676442.1 acylneuraminate cytidylyltransferase family protein [Asticcacaulis machinosus]